MTRKLKGSSQSYSHEEMREIYGLNDPEFEQYMIDTLAKECGKDLKHIFNKNVSAQDIIRSLR